MLRADARRLLAHAVEMEADAFLTAMQDRTLPDGRARLVRQGHGPEPAPPERMFIDRMLWIICSERLELMRPNPKSSDPPAHDLQPFASSSRRLQRSLWRECRQPSGVQIVTLS